MYKMSHRLSRPASLKTAPLLKTAVISACVYIGIDPGLSGALAFWNTATNRFDVVDMPTVAITRNGKTRRAIECVELASLIDLYSHGSDAIAYVEQVGAMPGQGVTSMFTFGRSVGVVEGELAALGIDTFWVPPRVWQQAAGIPPRSDKSAHRREAQRVFPMAAPKFARQKDDGRADAALICRYATTQNPNRSN